MRVQSPDFPKLATAAESTRATVLAAGDLGCLLHIGGSLSRQNSPIVTRHVAEVLAGDNGLAIEP